MNNTLMTRRIPGLALASQPKPGFQLLDLGAFGFARDLVGADDHGYNQESDVLVTQTTDGVDYNELWREFAATIRIQNAERQAIVDFLTFDVTNPSESVSQLSGAKFEVATEYGEPRGVRQSPTTFWLGYDFVSYDIAVRYTWKYLSNASASQVQALHSSVIEADNQNVFEGVMKALYQSTNRIANINDQAVNVYALYNGDGTVPPTYKSNVFDNTHTHYLVSGGATIDDGDLDDVMEHLRHHGYSAANGMQQIIAMNSAQAKVVRGFRIADGDTYDFIPSTSEATALVLEPGQSISGGRPASTYRGLRVIGSYGEALIIEDDLFVPGYIVGIATGGRQNLNNPVGFRQHQNPQLRGLKLVKGATPDYPLIDSFYIREFGTGIRQRGGAVVMQIKATGSYVAPAQYVF